MACGSKSACLLDYRAVGTTLRPLRKCPGDDSNLHGMLLPLGPEPSASANSATWARLRASKPTGSGHPSQAAGSTSHGGFLRGDDSHRPVGASNLWRVREPVPDGNIDRVTARYRRGAPGICQPGGGRNPVPYPDSPPHRGHGSANRSIGVADLSATRHQWINGRPSVKVLL